jgi:type II secretory pathway pseudopilin PulG
MGIIVVIIGILLPTLLRARKNAYRGRVGLDLQGISQALEAYRQDFRDYPRIDYTSATSNPIGQTDSTYNPTPPTDRIGAVTLCWALLSPGPATAASGGDGADGPGFRVRGTQGQVYGPYLQPGKFTVSGTSDWNSTINDVRGNPYLYFPGFAGANINVAKGFVGNYTAAASPNPIPMYNYGDNPILQNGNQFTLKQMQIALGDKNFNGGIDASIGETPATTAPYLLWSAGPDDIYGAPLLSNGTYGTSDDVTNFSN